LVANCDTTLFLSSVYVLNDSRNHAVDRGGSTELDVVAEIVPNTLHVGVNRAPHASHALCEFHQTGGAIKLGLKHIAAMFANVETGVAEPRLVLVESRDAPNALESHNLTLRSRASKRHFRAVNFELLGRRQADENQSQKPNTHTRSHIFIFMISQIKIK